MSRKQNIAKNPFKCFDCKTFCTSTYRGLQMHRNSSCAYVKSKKEQLHKKFKLGSSTKMGPFVGVDDFEVPKKGFYCHQLLMMLKIFRILLWPIKFVINDRG